MPSVLRIGPYRFHFYAGEGDEPPHVHVARDRAEAKLWLDPVSVARSQGFRAAELRRIQRITQANQAILLDAWNNRPLPGSA